MDYSRGGVPLAHYAQHHPGTVVRFSCEVCKRSADVPLPNVLARLKARRWAMREPACGCRRDWRRDST